MHKRGSGRVGLGERIRCRKTFPCNISVVQLNKIHQFYSSNITNLIKSMKY